MAIDKEQVVYRQGTGRLSMNGYRQRTGSLSMNGLTSLLVFRPSSAFNKQQPIWIHQVNFSDFTFAHAV